MSYTNILQCDFRMASLTETSLAGINVKNIKSFSDLNFGQAGKLTTSYLTGNIPLSFTLNLEGKNPNPNEARMAQFDWIIKIDDVQIATGTNHSEHYFPPNNGTKTIPLNVKVNLLDVLTNESKDALFNFALNLADASNKPTRVGLQIRPSIYLNDIAITYPGYIEIGTEF